MKHLKKIFEQESGDPQLDEVLDNFLTISDVYGDPSVSQAPYAYQDSKLRNFYRLEWQVFSDKMDINNGVAFATNIKKLGDMHHDIASASKRLSNQYDMSFQINGAKLIITLLPQWRGLPLL